MKKISNKKADSSIWGIVIAVAGMMIFAVVAIAFTSAVTTVSTSAIGTTQCKVSIQQKEKVNKEVDKQADKAKEKVQGAAKQTAATAGCVGGAVTGGVIGLACGPLAIVCSPIGLGAGCLIGGIGLQFPASDAAGNIVDKTKDLAKIHTDLCIENFPDRCPVVIGSPATADLAAECVYNKAADTFYTLQGSRKGTKYKIENRKFNLFDLNVTVEEPGWILLQGSCSKYLAPKGIWKESDFKAHHLKDCDAVVRTGKDYVCGADLAEADLEALSLESNYDTAPITAFATATIPTKGTAATPASAAPPESGGSSVSGTTGTGTKGTGKAIGGLCNVTFSTVNEATMTLTMVSRCQEAGPDEQNVCKCFANPDYGYETANGLPNAKIDGLDHNLFKDFEKQNGATYTTAFDGTPRPATSYKGCGVFQGKNEIKFEGATIKQDHIDAKNVNIELGKSGRYYLRIEREKDDKGNGIDRVVYATKKD